MVRTALVLALFLAACPESPSFEEGDSRAADTQVDSLAPTTDTQTTEGADSDTSVTEIASETIEDVEVVADADTVAEVADVDTVEVDAEVIEPPPQPCARPAGCTVLVSTKNSPSVFAFFDPLGYATVGYFDDQGDDTYELQLHRYRGPDDWDVQAVGAGLSYPTDLAIASDSDGRVHVLAEALNDGPSPTIWYRPTETGWEPDVLMDDDHCERPLFVKDASGTLFASCVVIDELVLHIRRLADVIGAQSWVPSVSCPGVGYKDGTGKAFVLPIDWDFDHAGYAHVAYRCCDPTAPELFHTSYTENGWSDGDNFGRTEYGSGISYLQTRVVVDGANRVHVIYQTWEPDPGRGALYDEVFDGEGWKRTTIDYSDPPGAALYLPKTVRDSHGNVHLVYRDGARVSYRVLRDNVWSGEERGAYEVTSFIALSVTVDRNDVPHVVYNDIDGNVWWWLPPEPAL